MKKQALKTLEEMQYNLVRHPNKVAQEVYNTCSVLKDEQGRSFVDISNEDRNMLVELDGQPPMEVLRNMFETLPERDRGLLQNSLFLGVVMDELIDSPVQGDFLIRNVVGMDQATGGLAIGEMLKEGQLVQFHLRDAETSTDDLQAVLTRYANEHRENDIPGALLFSCLGRGQYLYGKPNHDTDLFRDKLGDVPLGGFFCNGEISHNRVYSYTGVLSLFL